MKSGAGRASWTERAPSSLEQRWDPVPSPPWWGSAEQVVAIRLWARVTLSAGSGPSSQMQGEGRGDPEPRSLQAQLPCCSGFLSVSLPTQGTVQLVTLWLSLLKTPLANWTTRMECGHNAESQAPWPMSPCGWLIMNPYIPPPLGLRLCGLVLYYTYGWFFSVATGGLKA